MKSFKFFGLLLLVAALLLASVQAQDTSEVAFSTPSVQRTTSVPVEGLDAITRIFSGTDAVYAVGFLNLANLVNMTEVSVFANNATTASASNGNGTSIFNATFTPDNSQPANASAIFVSKTSSSTGEVLWFTTVPVGAVNAINKFVNLFVDEAHQRVFVAGDWVDSISLPDGIRTSSADDNMVTMSVNTTDGSITWVTTSVSDNSTASISTFDVALSCDNQTLVIGGGVLGSVNISNIVLNGSFSDAYTPYVLAMNATTGRPLRSVVGTANITGVVDAFKVDCSNHLLYVLAEYTAVNQDATQPPFVFNMVQGQHTNGCLLAQFTLPNIVPQRALSLGVSENNTCGAWTVDIAFNGTR